MKKLSETVEGMNSPDYKERFKAEYEQNIIRIYDTSNLEHRQTKGSMAHIILLKL